MRYCAYAVLMTALLSANVFAANELILNEWNCVGDLKQLDGGDPAFTPKENANGGNWIELVVVTDNLDITGWTLEWANDDPNNGSVTFSNDTLWQDLRAGTIITIMEWDTNIEYSIEDSDTSFDPNTGDWHIHVALHDDTYVSHSGAFKVDNDNWRMRIMDGATVVQGWIGESISGWSSGSGNGINSREVGKLEANPSSSVGLSNYDDGDNSTFGAPNTWGGNSQDFSTLRSWF